MVRARGYPRGGGYQFHTRGRRRIRDPHSSGWPRTGPEIRRGMVELNGKVIRRRHCDTRFGKTRLRPFRASGTKLEGIEKGLPEGVEIVTVYDRGDLILKV